MAQQVIAFKQDGSMGLSEPVEISSPTSRTKSQPRGAPVRGAYQQGKKREPIYPELSSGEGLSGEEENPGLMEGDQDLLRLAHEEDHSSYGSPIDESELMILPDSPSLVVLRSPSPLPPSPRSNLNKGLTPLSPASRLQGTSVLDRSAEFSTSLRQEEEEEEEAIRRPRARKGGIRARRIVQAGGDVEPEEDEGEESDEVVRSSIRKGKARATFRLASEDDSPEEASRTRISPSKSLPRQEITGNLKKKTANNAGKQALRRQNGEDDIFGGKSFVVLIESPKKKVLPTVVISDTESDTSMEGPSTRASRSRGESHTPLPIKGRRKITPLQSIRKGNSKKAEKSVAPPSSDSNLPDLGELPARKPSKPARPSTATRKRPRLPTTSSSSDTSQESDINDFIDHDDDEMMGQRFRGSSSERETEVARVKKKAKVKKLSSIVKAARKRNKGSADGSSGGSDVNDFIASEGEESSSAAEERRRGKKVKKVKKAKKAKKAKRRERKESDEDGEEDEDDLELSGKETVLKERFRNRKSSPSKFELLRAARQRRLGNQDSSAAPASSHLSLDDDIQEEEDSQDSDLPSSTEYSADGVDLDENLEGLIDEELEEDAEAQKVVAEFRNELASQAQGLRFYLKTYIQWIIRMIACPEIDWLEEHKDYMTAFRIVEDSSRSLLNSLIGSMAWRIPYKKAITALPNFFLEDLLDGERGCACDACSMGGSRHATFKLTLDGDKYDRKTFRSEEVSSSAEEESDEEQEEFGRSWNLGTNCAGRSQVYSELTHAGFHLYEEIFQILAPVRKIYPKIKLPATASRKRHREEYERMAKLNQTEAERLTVLLEEEGTVNKLADAWMKRVDDAKRDFTER